MCMRRNGWQSHVNGHPSFFKRNFCWFLNWTLHRFCASEATSNVFEEIWMDPNIKGKHEYIKIHTGRQHSADPKDLVIFNMNHCHILRRSSSRTKWDIFRYHARNNEEGKIWFLFPYIILSAYKMVLKVMEFRKTFHSAVLLTVLGSYCGSSCRRKLDIFGYHARNNELGQIWFLFPYIVFKCLQVLEFRTTFHSAVLLFC